MRTIQTFVIRLLVEREAPLKLRGAVQNAAGTRVFSFQSEQELLDLLRQMAAEPETEAEAGQQPDRLV